MQLWLGLLRQEVVVVEAVLVASKEVAVCFFIIILLFHSLFKVVDVLLLACIEA